MAKNNFTVGVILPAAGAGTRFGEAKQFRIFDGHTLLEHALIPFLDIAAIHEIVIVVPVDRIGDTAQKISPFSAKKQFSVVAGGERRQDSVRAGLRVLDKDCTIVCIHDAARPFLNRRMIEGTIAACKGNDGAIAAIPVSDTLKRVSDGGRHIEETIQRETVWQAQTPQTFQRQALEEALAAADRDGITGTDESALLERLGYSIAVIEGSPANLKITTTEDWAVAEALWRKRFD
jgi:2-C-methyl-D-erythritol 4-phosphate cytidylyltransferase